MTGRSEGASSALDDKAWQDLVRYTSPGTENFNAAMGLLSETLRARNLAGVAAISLHFAGPDGKPLFKRADVEVLRAVAQSADLLMENRPDGYWSDDVATAEAMALSLAERLASLLPPEHSE